MELRQLGEAHPGVEEEAQDGRVADSAEVLGVNDGEMAASRARTTR
ncbi:MAG TPA: hypothetical protein VFQ15_04300 [Jiangellaceae bacterium]|nr:hypothetical protein [Jiangellaceae bacterium]